METERQNLFKITSQSSNAYSQTMRRLQSAGQITRTDILTAFPKDKIEECWSTFTRAILKNYQSGKGTSIPKFGVFTFNNAEVNLEGTTNEVKRDLKARKPVFIVSPDFAEKLKPGVFTSSSGLIYYTQKQNNNTSHVKINFSEMAYSLSMKKEDVFSIIDNLIKYMSQAISRNEFKNKEMPELGLLVVRNNIIGVKFNEEMVQDVKLAPQRLVQTKKRVNLFMEAKEKFTNAPFEYSDNLPNVEKTARSLRPKTAVITKITKDAEKWLKEKYDINLEEVMKENSVTKETDLNNESKDLVENRIFSKTNFQFINDTKPKLIKKMKKLDDLNIPFKVMESIYFHKGPILAKLKLLDKANTGMLRFQDFISAFTSCKLDSEFTEGGITELINLYSENKQDFLIYNDIMGKLLKEIQTAIFEKKTNRPNTARTSNNSFQVNNKLKDNSDSNATSSGNTFRPQSSNPLMIKKSQLEDCIKEIKTIKIILDKIKLKNLTRLEQKISINEFVNILREFSIVFPKEKIEKILNFLEISDPKAFSLNEFITKLNNCKILISEMSTEDIIACSKKLKDSIFSLGGKTFLFGEKETITKEEFIKLLLPKVNYSEEVLSHVFIYITKTERQLTLEDYFKYFENNRPNSLDEEFEKKSLSIINENLFKKGFKHEDYFNHLLNYKKNRAENFLSLTDFHKAMTSEKYPFTAEELNYLFKYFDFKKDNKIDREEFISCLTKVFNALHKIQDIIKNNKLEIEDLLFRMKIEEENVKSNLKLDFFQFKSKMKLLDSTFDHYFIKSLFEELADDNHVDLETLIKEFSVYKKEHFRNTNNETFKQNFISEIRKQTSYFDLRPQFEKIDSFNDGLLKKIDFCSIIQKITNEFKDEDIMKFIRITSLLKGEKVKYTEFLDLIFYSLNENKFTEMVKKLSQNLKQEFKGDINSLFKKINNNKTNSSSVSIESMHDYLKSNNINLNIEKNTVCKLDIDNDGRISLQDLRAVIERYNNTSFFKYENSDKVLDVNIFSEEQMDEEKFKQIVKDIKSAMKNKNITEIGLFNKLDGNKDSFVSHPEFCKHIDEIIKISPGIKDQFFNYLDVRKLGMVDLDTFLKRFKEFKSADIIIKNDWTEEEKILTSFSEWIRRNTKLTEEELFAVLDSDCDGLINSADFYKFVIEKLNFSKNEISNPKLERVMQRISLTKNINIGLSDVKNFCLQCRQKKEEMNSISNLTFTSSNMNNQFRNKNWIDEAIVRLGLYVSENYESIDTFFETLASENKVQISKFISFLAKEHKCYEGFNLTSDEILTVFSALDPHKKNHLTLTDLKNKLSPFDFYRKMHLDIKMFIQNNFVNGEEAFNYFKSDKHVKYEKNNLTNSAITKKELFDGINNLFPGKYQTETILKWLNKKFKLTNDEVTFSEFIYLFYGEIKKEESKTTSLLGASLVRNQRAKSAHPTNRNKSNNKSLSTAFDDEPMDKIKRIINSSRFDYTNYFKMYELISENGMVNQFEFKNILKKLNLGLSSLEIDQIILKVNKTWDGKINLKEFMKFLKTEDSNLAGVKKNISIFVSKLKQLIYKYYSSPNIAFQHNDQNITNQMDFVKFKNLVSDLFQRDSQPLPNFAIIKNAFEFIDIRRDGIIDANEWLRTFSKIESDLDVKTVSNPRILKELREWENSRDVSVLYNLINKNKKIIKEKVTPMLIHEKGVMKINSENLISVLKEVLPDVNLNTSQWKIIIHIGDQEKNSMVDFNLFMNVLASSAKQFVSHPYTRK